MSTSSTMGNQYLEGNFAPVGKELTVTDLAVTGTIPNELNGRYMRSGPNPIGPVDPETYHWFTGTGMVHGVQLGGGRAGWYRNRWVRARRRSSAELGEPGWLLSLSHDPARDASDLVIIDAADFLGPEVGRVHLPQRVPFGLHGNFVTDPRG